MPNYRVTDPDSGVTLTLQGDSPPTEDELQQVFSEYQKRTSQFQPTGVDIAPSAPGEQPLAQPWFVNAAPVRGAAQEVAKTPGSLMRTAGTVSEVMPIVDLAEGQPPSPDIVAENMRRAGRSPAQTIRDVQQNPLVRKGAELEEAATKAIPLTEEEKKDVLTKIGQGAGSMVPYVASGPFAPGVIGLQSFSDHLSEDFEKAKSEGKSEEDAAKEAFTKAIVSGGIQATIFAALPKPLRKLGDKWLIDRYGYDTIKRFLAGRVANIGEGAVLGAASRISENAVEGQDLGKDVLDSAAGMGALLAVSPRGLSPEQATERAALTRRPVNRYVPPESGPSALTQVIPFGGTTPQRTRIRLTVGDTTPRVPQSELPKQDSPSGLYPAIRLIGGDVVVGKAGETHPDIIDREKLDAKDIDQRGFVDKAGKFLDREQAAAITGLPTQSEENRLHSTDLPATKGTSDQTKTQGPEGEVVQTGPIPPVQGLPTDRGTTVETQAGVTQPKGPDQTTAQLNVPTAEELSAMSTTQFADFWNGLKENRLAAQQKTANTTSPVKLRQYAQQAADDVTRIGNEFEQKKKAGGTLTEADMLGFQNASYKFQYFNEALREAGEPPVQVQSTTVETQVGRRKKPSGGRTPGMTPKEVGLIQKQEALENDWSVATKQGKVNVNADELKTDDVITVRGEPLTVTNVDPEDGSVTLQSAKGGRWGERKLQAGQQISVDEFKPSQEDLGFEPKEEKEEKFTLESDRTIRKTRDGVWIVEEPDGTFLAKAKTREEAEEIANRPAQKKKTLAERGFNEVEQRTSNVYQDYKNEFPDLSKRNAEDTDFAISNPDSDQGGLEVDNPKKIKVGDWVSVKDISQFTGRLLEFPKGRVVSIKDDGPRGIFAKVLEWSPNKTAGWIKLDSVEKLGEKPASVDKPTTPVVPVGEQKYRIQGEGPQLYTLVERLKQTETEKAAGEQPVRVRNDKTGKEDVVLEAQLQPVKERTTEEKAATKGMTKRELDDALRKFGMDPTEFSNSAQKREAIKRARAKSREATFTPLSDRVQKIWGEFKQRYGVQEVSDYYVELLKDVVDNDEFKKAQKELEMGYTGPIALGNDIHRYLLGLTVPQKELVEVALRIEPELREIYDLNQTDSQTRMEGFALEKISNLLGTDPKLEFVKDPQEWADIRRDVWQKDPGLGAWVDDVLFPDKFKDDPRVSREASLQSSALNEFSTPDQIRRSLYNAKRISEPHRKALDWIVRSGIMDRLPGLRIEIVDYIRGGAVGEYTRDNRVARFLSWTDSDVPIHEFWHDVWGYLQPEDRQFISDLRKASIAEKAPQMGDTFADGISSDEFVEGGYSRDLYQYANDGEFFAWLMTEKAQADLNKPQARTFVAKIREIVRDLWNGLKDALGFNQYQDVLWRQVMSGKYEFTPEDGIRQAAYDQGRELALVRSRTDAAEQTINYGDMSDTQKKDIGSDVELQNNFVEPLATRLVTGRSRGIVSKLQKVFGDRLAALAEIRGRGDRHDVQSYAELMAAPGIDNETKQIIVGDMEKNVRDFRSTAEATIRLSDSKIEDYQNKIVRLTEDLDVQKARRDVLAAAARRIVSDYQNRYLQRIRQGGQVGEASVSAEVMRQLQQLRQSPEIVGRIIDQIATTVSPDVLTRPGVTAPELLQALIQANGGNLETLSAAMGEAQRGVSREMLQVAIGIMQASDQLAENVLAIRPTINPENVREIESLAVELRQAATRGARADMRQLIREVGGTAQTLSMVRGAIGRLQPRIRRAARQLDEWLSTQEILEQARNDPALKALEKQVYDHFDVRSVVVTEGGDHEYTIKNPLTNEPVKILVGLDKITSGENYAKLQRLFDDAAAYLANPEDPNYDPRLAASWRYMIENAQQFWLNPSMNVFMPHQTPFQFDLPGFLSDPWKVLRTNAGLETNAAQVKLNAMAKVKKMLMEWDRKTGSTVDIANKKAARISKMTVDQWYEDVFDQIAFHNQYIGQIAPKVGDLLTSGHVVTAADLEALKVNFEYLRRVRDIAENSDAFTAANVNPARVIQGGISRRAEPTGPVTLPSKRSARALNWAREWRRLGTWQDRMRWLNDGDRFMKIVVAHMDTYSTPGYTIPTLWREAYKDMVYDIRRGDGPESIEEMSDILYDTQNLDELGQNAMTREQIQQGIVEEIARGFRNYEAEPVTRQRAKPDPEIDALTAENSFTKPRSDKVTSPHSFYDYGVKDYPGRLRAGNDAYVWYGLDFVESLQRVKAALDRRIGELTKGLQPKELRGVQKATKAAQLRGEEMFDLAELKLNAKRIDTLLKQQTRVLKSSRAGRTSLESAFFRAQSTVGSLILMTPGARATHTFGMMGNSGVFNALIENRVVRPSVVGWYRLVSNGVKDMLKIPVSIPGLKVTNEQLRSWPGIAQSYAEMVIKRREQMDRLKEQAMIPESHFVGAWKSLVEDWKNIFRRDSPESLSTRIVRGGLGLSDAYNAAAMSYAPQRYNDWVLNSSIREARNDFVLHLQENALKHLRNRSDVLGTGYSDFSRPENVLTAQEITGRKGPGAEREAFEKRRLFKSLGMDLDEIMLRYFRAVDEAQANGADTNQIAFLTEAEGKSLDWEFAQGMGLSTPATRNLAAQGSGILRRGAGYIHGLPLSTMGRYLSLFNRLSNQTAPKYAAAVAYPVLGASLYMTLMGLLKIQSTATLNRIFYKQSSALPTISQAKTPDDWARLMLRAFALWFPIAGDIVLGSVLRTPDRFGHLDSMFVMYQFLQDLVNTGGDIWHSKDIAGPLTKFGERWMPPVKIITRRLDSQSGVREHYNAVADIQSALPSSMETAAAKFRGGLRPTETTPLTYKALNAMYNGNWEEFDRIAQEYAQKKADQGVKDGFLAFKHSISAHNPWIERLGKLPTQDEREQILSRMDDTQKAEVQKAEDTFRQFADRYNTRVAFTLQQSEAQKGAAGGGREPTAGAGSLKLPGKPGIGNVNVPHRILPPGLGGGGGLRRISIGGRASSPFIAAPTRRGGISPRRLSLGAPRAARRFTSGRLRATPRALRRRGSRRRRISLA